MRAVARTPTEAGGGKCGGPTDEVGSRGRGPQARSTLRMPLAFLQEARARCGPEMECPALLFGRGNSVERWSWPRNVAASPYAFRLDPEEMYRHISAAGDMELLAIFHTHPGPPLPSPADLRHMRLWPVVWVIADVYTWGLAAWRLADGLESVGLELC